MKKKVTWIMICLVLASFVLAACSSGSNASNFPTGKFVDPNDRFAGFTFNPDGTWNAFSLGEIIAQGTYSVKGNIYTEKTNDQGCDAPMSFQYSYDGTNLKFQLTDEAKADTTCAPRKEGFDNKSYILSK